MVLPSLLHEVMQVAPCLSFPIHKMGASIYSFYRRLCFKTLSYNPPTRWAASLAGVLVEVEDTHLDVTCFTPYECSSRPRTATPQPLQPRACSERLILPPRSSSLLNKVGRGRVAARAG